MESLWVDEQVALKFGESFAPLADYIWLAKNTESPKQYHLWSLLSLTNAIASNHAWLSHGVAGSGRLRLNMGVILTGRSSIRKGSAISFMQRFASDIPLNYGPTDTGGARHGVMGAMQTRWQDDVRDEDDMELLDIKALAESNFDEIVARMQNANTRPASLYFVAKELGRILTAQTRELLDFFNDGMDCEPIDYRTKNGSVRIPFPMINLIGATTPGSLPFILPRDSHDHGLLSRFIFVYAKSPEKAVPIPPDMSKAEHIKQEQLLTRLKRISELRIGQLSMTQEAKEEYIKLYSYAVHTSEFKLNAYAGRRTDHLLRVAAAICILRAEEPYAVNRQDIGLAHLILMLTEQDMDAAYAGLDRSQESKTYAIIRETLESGGIDPQMSRDYIRAQLIRNGMTNDQIASALDRLTNARRIGQDEKRIWLIPSLAGHKAMQYLNQF